MRPLSHVLVPAAVALTSVATVAAGVVALTSGSLHRSDAVASAHQSADLGLGSAPVAPAPTPLPVLPVTSPSSLPAPQQAHVAPLRHVVTPDLLVTVPRTATPAQLHALRGVRGLSGLAVLDTGSIHVGAFTARAVGVDPGQLRPFTPTETATSDPLWDSVLHGELASSYALARTHHLVLGRTLPTSGAAHVPLRLGAEATFGLPGTDLVVERTAGRQLGLVPSTAFLVAAPGRDLAALQSAVRAALGPAAALTTLRPQTVTHQRPTTYRALFIDSAKYCPGLSWTVLAAIGQVESGDGRNVGPSSAGALGPMQFLPSTWAYAGVDGDGDGKADILSPFDAVPAAALYLCRDGAGRGGQALYDAIFSYNHADSYVQEILALAAKYH